MGPEHAHYRCQMCGYRDTCCDGAPALGREVSTRFLAARHAGFEERDAPP